MSLIIGYDVGTSSIKASLFDAARGCALASATSPGEEMPIEAPQPGWAQQDPEAWWEHVQIATRMLAEKSAFDPAEVKGLGISYQMHGLVLVDAEGRALRPSIIWCDSRAVASGEGMAEKLGAERCLERLLNLPGNFTAAKLMWVKENEPEIYSRAAHYMLPGDFIALRMTGRATTTASGLSEGMAWDYLDQKPAGWLFEELGLDAGLIPEIVPAFGHQGDLSAAAAEKLGLKAGTPVTYRAGDQPNNALSLNALEPGEAAVTAGTSGVVYAVTDRTAHDPASRVNAFVHVNSAPGALRQGVLLCLNGTGCLNSWMRRNVAAGLDYPSMNELASTASAGAAGLRIYPYGNGAERTLGNRAPGASMRGLDFNIHTRAHMLRAAQEGIVFALNYGVEVLGGMGLSVGRVRAGAANMFLSPLFAEAFATVTGASVELYETDGSLGAARGAGVGAGVYASTAEAFADFKPVRAIEPNPALCDVYREAYLDWRAGMTL